MLKHYTQSIKLPFLTFICGTVITVFGAKVMRENRLNQSYILHRQLQAEKLAEASRSLKNIFSLTYDSLRTMALLPGVARISRHDKKINDDAVMSMQQLYNSIASHVAVSEIYIVPAALEPDSIDPVTGKLEEPIMTFDHIITGVHKDKSKSDADLEEVEIFEYREMKKQIKWFKENYPRRSSIAHLQFPALSSPPVVTCDNTEFSAEDLAHKDDSPRMGIVYSVPFYGPQGELKGLVSAVLRTKMLLRAIDLPESLIESPGRTFTLGRILEQNHTHPFAFYQQNSIETSEPKPWTISYFVSGEDFLSAPAQKAIFTDSKYVILAGMALTLLLTWSLLILSANRLKAESLANKMAELAEVRQEALLSAGKMASLGEMVSNLAHEINNPMAVILGKTETIQRNLKKTPFDFDVAQQDLSKIIATCKRITAIVKGLKSFSRNSVNDPLVRVSINEIITDTIEFCAQRYREQEVDLRVGPIPNVEIEARSSQISQIILNLLNNSLDAISGLSEKWVLLEVVLTDGNCVQLSVTDSGKGIPPEITKKLSQPFFTTKEVGKGTGLGLSISRRIATEHSGKLSLDENSKNTRFVLELPLPKTSIAQQ